MCNDDLAVQPILDGVFLAFRPTARAPTGLMQSGFELDLRAAESACANKHPLAIRSALVAVNDF